MRDSVREYLSYFPGDERRSQLKFPESKLESAPLPGGFFLDHGEMRKHAQLKRFKASANVEGMREFLSDAATKLSQHADLTRTESEYLGAALSDIADGKEPLRALLLKKGRGRPPEDHRKIVAEVLFLRALGKSLNQARLQVAETFEISVTTVKRAEATPRAMRVGERRPYGEQRTSSERRLFSEVSKSARETGCFFAACKCVARIHEVDWKAICYNLSVEDTFKFLGADAVRREATFVDSVAEREGLGCGEITELDPEKLDALQAEIGCKVLEESGETSKKRRARSILYSVLHYDALIQAARWSPSLGLAPDIYVRHGFALKKGRNPEKLGVLLSGVDPPQELRQNSFLELSLQRALVAFLVSACQGRTEEEQWLVAEELESQIRSDIKKWDARLTRKILGNMFAGMPGATIQDYIDDLVSGPTSAAQMAANIGIGAAFDAALSPVATIGPLGVDRIDHYLATSNSSMPGIDGITNELDRYLEGATWATSGSGIDLALDKSLSPPLNEMGRFIYESSAGSVVDTHLATLAAGCCDTGSEKHLAHLKYVTASSIDSTSEQRFLDSQRELMNAVVRMEPSWIAEDLRISDSIHATCLRQKTNASMLDMLRSVFGVDALGNADLMSAIQALFPGNLAVIVGASSTGSEEWHQKIATSIIGEAQALADAVESLSSGDLYHRTLERLVGAESPAPDAFVAPPGHRRLTP